jgi:tRNA A37 threonylcarbamoyladenosine dehydratase
MDQFLRTRLLLGSEKFERIRSARVTVVGLGAVGGYVTEALTRAGVGSLRLIDCDKVSLTNLNRQLLALHSTVGIAKAAVARARVLDINPSCAVEAIEAFAAHETFASLFDNAPDLVIDAIDAVNPKAGLLEYCYKQHIPVLSSMGAALRTNPLAIRIGDLFDTSGCPLASRMRKMLRTRGVGRGIECVYSSEPITVKSVHPDSISEPGGNANLGIARGRQRMVLGSLPTITGIFGLILAQRAIDLLTKK